MKLSAITNKRAHVILYKINESGLNALTLSSEHNYYAIGGDEKVNQTIFSMPNGDTIETTGQISHLFAGLVVVNDCYSLRTPAKYVAFNAHLIVKLDDMCYVDKPRYHHATINDALKIGLILEKVFYADGVKWLMFRKNVELFTQGEAVEKYLPLFHAPLESLDHQALTFKKRSGFKPEYFEERSIPDVKAKILLESVDILDNKIAEKRRSRFMGKAIMKPNKEQTAVLMASGRFNDEVRLNDGRLMSFKGTEQITYDERIKTDVEGNPTAIREILVRETVVIGLDLTNGKYITFK
jgi:hypothetical protein